MSQLARDNNINQQRGRTTDIEKIGYRILEQAGVRFIRQYDISKFCVDAYIPTDDGNGIVVQFDGDYWHGNPETYPVPNAIQRMNIQRDRSQESYLRKCGYRTIRIFGSELKRSPSALLAKLHSRHWESEIAF